MSASGAESHCTQNINIVHRPTIPRTNIPRSCCTTVSDIRLMIMPPSRKPPAPPGTATIPCHNNNNKDQLSLTNPRNELRHGERARERSVSYTCDRAKLTTLGVESRQFSATSPVFNILHLHLAPLLGLTPFEFCRYFRHHKIRVSGLSGGFSA